MTFASSAATVGRRGERDSVRIASRAELEVVERTPVGGNHRGLDGVPEAIEVPIQAVGRLEELVEIGIDVRLESLATAPRRRLAKLPDSASSTGRRLRDEAVPYGFIGGRGHGRRW